MNETAPKHGLSMMSRPRASFGSRLATVLVIGLLLAVFGVARSLEPDSKGYGTHQQLGLPPCGSVLLFSQRCPACGMTTSWSYALRGRWPEAFAANAGGSALLLIGLAYIPIFCYYLARGYWSRQGWLSFSLALSLMTALLIALAQWITRLVSSN